jgi:hypothetical protein
VNQRLQKLDSAVFKKHNVVDISAAVVNSEIVTKDISLLIFCAFA